LIYQLGREENILRLFKDKLKLTEGEGYREKNTNKTWRLINEGVVASWLVRPPPDRAVWVHSLPGEIASRLARHLTFAVHSPHPGVLGEGGTGEFNARIELAMDRHLILGGGGGKKKPLSLFSSKTLGHNSTPF